MLFVVFVIMMWFWNFCTKAPYNLNARFGSCVLSTALNCHITLSKRIKDSQLWRQLVSALRNNFSFQNRTTNSSTPCIYIQIFLLCVSLRYETNRNGETILSIIYNWHCFCRFLQGIGSVQKKSWLRALSASIRSAGSNVSSLSTKSNASWSLIYIERRWRTFRFWSFGNTILWYRSNLSTFGHA